MIRARGEVRQPGRPIHPSAYSYFISALHDEAEGNLKRAESLYLATLKEDPESGAAWAGLIRTGCHRSREHIEEVMSGAQKAADRPALALVEYADCLIVPKYAHADDETARLESAASASRKAMSLEPLFKPATQSLARALHSLGKKDEAEQVGRAYELYVKKPLEPGNHCVECVSLEAIDRALFQGDIDRAKDLSTGRMTSGEFSARVLSVGNARQAQLWAEVVLANDPLDPDARIVFALTQPREPKNTHALLTTDGRSPSRLAALLYLVRLSGSYPRLAKRLLQDLPPPDREDEDQLILWWETRLQNSASTHDSNSGTTR